MAIDCLQCSIRGACCKSFKIIFKGKSISWENGFMSEEIVNDFLIASKLPFKAIGLESSDWFFSCEKLDQETGLCTIHEQRPAICRSYIPGSEGTLCQDFGKPNVVEWLADSIRNAMEVVYRNFFAS